MSKKKIRTILVAWYGNDVRYQGHTRTFYVGVHKIPNAMPLPVPHSYKRLGDFKPLGQFGL